MSDEVLTIIEPSINGSEPRVLRFEDGKLSDKGTYIEALRKAELQRDELLEALKHCKEVLTIVNSVDNDLMTKDALERVCSAITKAEGGE